MECSLRPVGRARTVLALLCLTLLAPGAVLAAAPSLTVRVPMRDGTLLATDVYLPAGDGPWPVALARTPYDKNDFRSGGHGGINPSRFTTNGMALVVQDVRGRGASQGQARPYVDDAWGERQDGADTVAWIRQQPWANGKIATYGGSAVGISQLLLAGTGPVGVVGQYVRVAPVSAYLGFYQNGVWRKSIDDWLSGWPLAAGQLIRDHPHYDEYWRGQDLGTRLDQVHWPIVHLGGWFDYFLQGTIDAFTQLQENGAEGARGRQHLVIGPWLHGDIWAGGFARRAGALTFPGNAVLPAEVPKTFDWLSFWLTGQPASVADEPTVRYYVMGDVTDPQAPGNFWRVADHWPPTSRPLQLYFTADGGLDEHPPATATMRAYDYDPAKPVPTQGGLEIFLPKIGPQDQQALEGRPDVLVFSTPPLTEPREVTGRITVRLYAATTAQDTDFTAKLTDVYPDGRSILLADGIVRARFRRSLEQEELITPGQTYSYDIDLWSTSVVFNRGHRIRVAISSSNAPRFEPNPNTGGPLPIDRNEKPVLARQTITLGGTEASQIILPEVVGGGRP